MKKLSFAIILMLLSIFTFAQNGFQWDVTIALPKQKQQDIYNKTKSFIQQNNYLPEETVEAVGGDTGTKIIVLAKCKTSQTISDVNGEWIFNFNFSFLIDKNQSRIILNGIECAKAPKDYPLVPVSETYPDNGEKKIKLSEAQYKQLMTNLKSTLQKIVDDYKEFLIK